MEESGLPKDAHLKEEEERIKQLGDKSSQILLFLSFALVVVATMKEKTNAHQFLLREAMRWWSWALFPVVIGVVPIKELNPGKPGWYRMARISKVILIWIAVVCILIGAVYFAMAIPESFSS